MSSRVGIHTSLQKDGMPNVLDMLSGVRDRVLLHASLHIDHLHAADERTRQQLGGTHRNTGNIFAKPSERSANIDMRFPKTISEDQSQDLEREVSKQEIKTAVWGCGTDKSPGPDGFSFGFYQHFWPIIEHDVYMAVIHFFIHGEILWYRRLDHLYVFRYGSIADDAIFLGEWSDRTRIGRFYDTVFVQGMAEG
ncbi:hypothetical protein Tco_1122272 [Tanacetum coccineum]|uniref:Uncharacterized protein n=1 Tax=Tanacetum coccineum TaxID=301880 RepID=A0ABQ5J054_9ASTR